MVHRYLLLMLLAAAVCVPAAATEPWRMHTIDKSSKGADGVRLADVDQDGQLDIATGWEEGGRIRVCFQPAPELVTQPWPGMELARVKSPEDAVFADVNNDGWLDVVSCCEGKEQAVYFHLSPGGSTANVRRASAWKTELLPPSKNLTRWMFCEPLDRNRLIFGSKDPHGQIALWDASKVPPLRKLRDAGWIMSLRRFDIDRDGDADLLYSDRKGPRRSVGWLEQRPENEWVDHLIGGAGLEVMFLDIATIGGQTVLACNTRNEQVLLLTPGSDIRQPWTVRRIAHPDHSGAGKAVALGDLDRDGNFDLACTCGLAKDKRGVYWLNGSSAVSTGSELPEQWDVHDISGDQIGVKFDRIELRDIDQDGDLDLLTCEERDNLGVVWYENPHQQKSKRSF